MSNLESIIFIHYNFQEKVYEEIFSIFGSYDCEVTMKMLKQMEYTEMVIKETMRVYPSAPLIMREVEEDIELCKCICLINKLIYIYYIYIYY